MAQSQYALERCWLQQLLAGLLEVSNEVLKSSQSELDKLIREFKFVNWIIIQRGLKTIKL